MTPDLHDPAEHGRQHLQAPILENSGLDGTLGLQ